MFPTEHIRVEVAYALPDEQWILPLELPTDSTVKQAIDHSGILTRFPDIDLSQNAVGVFGRLVSLTRVLQEGDRVEIYRPLSTDPKLARRRRAEQARTRR